MIYYIALFVRIKNKCAVNFADTEFYFVLIMNIVQLQLTSSILNTGGPFLMLNALRVLPPDGTHTILISYTPEKGEVVIC